MDFFWLWIGTVIVSVALLTGIMLFGIIGEFYETWQTGRQIALFVTERNHQRRLDLLAKMIELEQLREAGDESTVDPRSSVPDGEGDTGDHPELPAAGGTEGCLGRIFRDVQEGPGALPDSGGQDARTPASNQEMRGEA